MEWYADLAGYTDRRIYMIGIKGTGMAALACALHDCGAIVAGSDVPESFYTDQILAACAIEPFAGFDASRLTGYELCVHSPAYNEENNEEVRRARESSLPCLEYEQLLGLLTKGMRTVCVAGTHGKSSVCAMLDFLFDALQVSHTALYGTACQKGGIREGNKGELLVLEACEYRSHFLAYHPDAIILTSIGYDHPDWFASIEETLEAFLEFCERLVFEGLLVYCADEPLVRQLVSRLSARRADLRLIPYGREAQGPWQVGMVDQRPGCVRVRYTDGRAFELRVPGEHMALNMSGALALIAALRGQDALAWAIRFPGSLRRSELVAQWAGVLFIDDYGHHPDEIRATLGALRSFYQPERMIVDFIPHTLSRTRALFDQFTTCFEQAEMVLVHPVLATVREQASLKECTELSQSLCSSVKQASFFQGRTQDVMGLVPLLKVGDLVITMGAGNNRWIGPFLARELSKRVSQ